MPDSPKAPKHDLSGLIQFSDASSTWQEVDASDASGCWTDSSAGWVDAPPIVNVTLNQVIREDGVVIVNQQGETADGSEETRTRFDGSGGNLTVEENLVQVVNENYNDKVDPSSETFRVMQEIQEYATEIQCTDFQGKGTLDDYSVLFQAASKIANDSKQMQLNVDIAGFDEFGAAADELSKLFTSFTVKLQNVSIIQDLSFLKSIAAALSKIVNLSNVFGRFKKTILAKSTVELPKSTHDATVLIEGVVSQVSCAMNYISYFVDPSSVASKPANSELSAQEKNVIAKAVSTIDSWNILCEQDISISMTNNADMQYIASASADFKVKASALQANTAKLRAKLASFC